MTLNDFIERMDEKKSEETSSKVWYQDRYAPNIFYLKKDDQYYYYDFAFHRGPIKLPLALFSKCYKKIWKFSNPTKLNFNTINSLSVH